MMYSSKATGFFSKPPMRRLTPDVVVEFEDSISKPPMRRLTETAAAPAPAYDF